ncbi:MAG: hypothetical protein HOF19_09180, partial [Gammaproteobacteria bacterium]|nr:hypothetical protein [Gammaproteobacteria bacterium]
MKKIHWFMYVLILTFSQLSHADPQTLVLIGTDLPVGEVDPYSEGSKDGGLTWGATYSVGEHIWSDLPDTTGWVNVYPCQGSETHDLFGVEITDPTEQCGLGIFPEGGGDDTVSWIRIRFHMPTTYSNATMDLQMQADNRGDVYLNDHELATIYGQTLFSGDFSAAVISEHLKPGLNTIKMKLTDFGGAVAFQYRIVIDFEANT